MPAPDRVPLMSLLNDAYQRGGVKAVAEGLMELGEFDRIDIGVFITQMTDELRGKRTSNGSGNVWPPRAGRSTTRGSTDATITEDGEGSA